MRLPRHRRGWLALALAGVAVSVVPAGAQPTPAPVNLVDTSCRLVGGQVVRTALAGPEIAPPVGNPPCPGIRPGAAYVTTVGGCTLGYVFAGSDGATYVATAGHCVDMADHAPRTYAVGRGPMAGDAATGKGFGRFVYSTHKGGETDFALIRLNPGVRADPQMCHFGGPTGMATQVNLDAVQLQHYGNGIGMGSSRARTALAVHGLRRPDWITAYGAMTPGDSGGPVGLTDGLAVGTVDEIRANGNGPMAITRLPAAVAAAAKALRIRLTLRTAPVL